MSDSRWRQIIKGYRQETKDVRVPVRAPADTLARMARAVGATAEQLREAGRSDAADELDTTISAVGTITASGSASGEVTRGAAGRRDLDLFFVTASGRISDANEKVGHGNYAGAMGDLQTVVSLITVLFSELGDDARSQALSIALASSGGWAIGTDDTSASAEAKLHTAQIAGILPPAEPTEEERESTETDSPPSTTQQDAPGETSRGKKTDDLAKRRRPPTDVVDDDAPPSIDFADAARSEPGHIKHGDRIQHLDEVDAAYDDREESQDYENDE